MIQRIQTLYLLGIVVLTTLMMCLPCRDINLNSFLVCAKIWNFYDCILLFYKNFAFLLLHNSKRAIFAS